MKPVVPIGHCCCCCSTQRAWSPHQDLPRRSALVTTRGGGGKDSLCSLLGFLASKHTGETTDRWLRRGAGCGRVRATGVLRERASPCRQRHRPETPPALRTKPQQRRTSRRHRAPAGIHTTHSSSGLRMCIWRDPQELCGLGFEESTYWVSKFSSSSFETVPATIVLVKGARPRPPVTAQRVLRPGRCRGPESP